MMNQKLLKKSAAFKIGIPLNGWRIRRPLPPVIIQEAFAEIANSKNLSSLRYLHSLMISVGEKLRSLVTIKLMINNLSSIETKYLSNFIRNNTSMYSSTTSWDDAIDPNLTALSKACLIVGFGKMEALTKQFVSKTKVLVFRIQYFIYYFFCKAPFSKAFSYFIQSFKKVFIFIGFYYKINICSKLFRNHFFKFRGCLLPFFCCCFIHFNYDPFHTFSFYSSQKYKK